MQQLKEFYQCKRVLKSSRFLLNKSLSNVISREFLATNLKSFYGDSINILCIKSSLNNTLVTLTNFKGKVLYKKSCGSLGFNGKKKRRTKFAIVSTLETVVSLIRELGFSKIFLSLNGFAKARFSILSILKKNKIQIVGVRDITPSPHNGCRPKKLRRG